MGNKIRLLLTVAGVDAFSMDNPFDINEPIYGIHYRTCGGGVKTAVFAITWEPL